MSHPYPDLDPALEPYYRDNMYTKFDTVQNALGAVLEKLGLGELDSFRNPKWWEVPGNPQPALPMVPSAEGPTDGERKPTDDAEDPTDEVRFGGLFEEQDEVEEPKEFEYKPLDSSQRQIRVLELVKDRSDPETLKGKLHHVSLDSFDSDSWTMPEIPDMSDPENLAKMRKDPNWFAEVMAESQPKEYTALSYTWGDSVFDASIIIDGQRASITTSLKNALVELSKIENLTQGKWWIDQVCINQSDVEERNAQVGLMREIYKLSRGVTIWLGEPVDPSYNAIDVIKGAILHNDRQPGRRERQHKKSTIEVVQKNWEELRRFFQMPWWSRCWVRQEVALTRDASICYGGKTLDFYELGDFFSAVAYVEDIGFHPETLMEPNPIQEVVPFYESASEILDLKEKNKHGTQFLELSFLLDHMRARKATDPRDKVYAILGLADHEIYDVPVDYRLPFEKVMTNAVLAIFKEEECPVTFGLCQNPERDHDVPSWAPNLLEEWKAQPFRLFNTGGHISGTPRMKVEGETLLTEGIFWETVDLVCDTVVPNDSTTGQLDAVMEAWQQFVDEAAEREDLQSYAIEYLQNNLASEYEYPTEGWKEFLSLDRIQANRYGDPPKTAKEVDEYHNMLDLKAVRSQLVDPAFKYDPYGHDLIRKNLVRYGTGRRLGLSTQGFIGLFPADVQEGDSIALVVGAPLPIVLRHVGGGEHVLVDEAWMPMVAGDELEESPRVTIRIV